MDFNIEAGQDTSNNNTNNTNNDNRKSFSKHRDNLSTCKQYKTSVYSDQLVEGSKPKARWVKNNKAHGCENKKYMVCQNCHSNPACITCKCIPSLLLYCDKPKQFKSTMMLDTMHNKWKCMYCIKEEMQQRRERNNRPTPVAPHSSVRRAFHTTSHTKSESTEEITWATLSSYQ